MIQPEFATFSRLINDRIFKIPEYQRHYSWETKQRHDLFDDILKLKENRVRFSDRIHFMATIVCLRTGESQRVGTNNYELYEVVDGQQRLTTLIVLLKAISKKLRSLNEISEADAIDKILVKEDNRLIILQNNHDNKQILRDYFEKGIRPKGADILTKADDNISDAISDCEKLINGYLIEDLIELVHIIKNCLYFIFQSVEDKGSVYTIFEVLNSRGLEVDWLDKCKSVLMGLLYDENAGDWNTLTDHVRELHELWSDVYKYVGLLNIQGHEIVRFSATLKSDSDAGSTLSAEESISFFKEKIISSEDKTKTIFDHTKWIKNVTYALAKLYEDKRKNAVTRITQARLLAVSIILKQDIDLAAQSKLLDQWERSTFRIYGLFRKDSRTQRGNYVRLAKVIQKSDSIDVKDMLAQIAKIAVEFPIEAAINEIKGSDCYKEWTQELRYLLYRYEEFICLKKKISINEAVWNAIWKSSPHTTIEHILPQSISDTGDWRKFNINHSKYVNNIGNLSILPRSLNSEANNDSFENKKLIYRRANVALYDDIIDVQDWTPRKIIQREEEILTFILKAWDDI